LFFNAQTNKAENVQRTCWNHFQQKRVKGFPVALQHIF